MEMGEVVKAMVHDVETRIEEKLAKGMAYQAWRFPCAACGKPMDSPPIRNNHHEAAGKGHDRCATFHHLLGCAGLAWEFLRSHEDIDPLSWPDFSSEWIDFHDQQVFPASGPVEGVLVHWACHRRKKQVEADLAANLARPEDRARASTDCCLALGLPG
jgi:hypothetical protein